jgi:hypothetical protein
MGDPRVLSFPDESGTPPKPRNAKGKYLVIAGVIIPEAAWHGIARDYKRATRRIRGGLRWKHFSAGNAGAPISHLTDLEKRDLRNNIFEILTARRAVKIICCVTCIEAAYARPSIVTQDDVYHPTYKGVTKRFQYFLQDATRVTGQTQYGLVVSDHRMAGDDKKLRKRHHELMEGDEPYTLNYANIIATIFFSPSEVSRRTKACRHGRRCRAPILPQWRTPICSDAKAVLQIFA